MPQQPNFSDPFRSELGSDAFWINLYSFLRPLVKHLVYSSGISSWHGQEEDLAEDVVQETIVRVLKVIRRAENGECTQIASPKALSIVIARHYYEDLRRRDKRLLRSTTNEHLLEANGVQQNHVDPSELALNNIFQEWLYVKFSLEAVKFSQKQRIALLVDLANRMDFSLEPTPLQKAFLDVGIQLQDYQQPLPKDPVERSRIASNTSLAYKRTQNWSRDNILS
jgi:DNA-directed RNA polymerase specialized sigma24 family protein